MDCFSLRWTTKTMVNKWRIRCGWLILEFRFDPGDSLLYIQSNKRVDTGDTVTATASYVSHSGTPFGTLQVGNGVQLKREVSGRLTGIQLYDNWYIGRVPPGLDMLNKTKGQAAPSSSFVGSIKDMQMLKTGITSMKVTCHHARKCHAEMMEYASQIRTTCMITPAIARQDSVERIAKLTLLVNQRIAMEESVYLRLPTLWTLSVSVPLEGLEYSVKQ